MEEAAEEAWRKQATEDSEGEDAERKGLDGLTEEDIPIYSWVRRPITLEEYRLFKERASAVRAMGRGKRRQGIPGSSSGMD